MSALVESFLGNGGKATFAESLDKNTLKDKNLLLLGGFVEDFAFTLQEKGIDLDSSKNQVFLLHPLHFNPCDFTQFVYEVGSEEAVIALLAYGLSAFGDEQLKEFAKTVDVGYLASECNFSEEELEEIVQSYTESGLTLLIGGDLATHKKASNIAKILALLTSTLQNLKIIFLESCAKVTSQECAKIAPLEEVDSYDGLVVYVQENPKKEGLLEVSKQFCSVSKIQENSDVKVRFLESNQEVLANMQCNMEFRGMVGILWASREKLQNGFCYQLVSLSKVA
ncbi:hypothetical protein LS70_008990 [Helicobacter sp. MIT 11-5569]|uniref:hypothetical protein n=1 Tax=Helicobacter sp. MIT 11-5569 TaxID=1548151 RepID=UPI000691BFB4|nr:hypothetical protein [Helicobacter sp. MIT 11-5569]TLD80600.1 hypothetical protein LS70_008990 [Helicobacter sp. MIT 11-5569]